jgi:hypothetical protein
MNHKPSSFRLGRWQLGMEILGLSINFGNGFIPHQTTFEKLLRRFCTNLHSGCTQPGARLRSPTVVNHSRLFCTQMDAFTRDGRKMHPSRYCLPWIDNVFSPAQWTLANPWIFVDFPVSTFRLTQTPQHPLQWYVRCTGCRTAIFYVSIYVPKGNPWCILVLLQKFWEAIGAGT